MSKESEIKNKKSNFFIKNGMLGSTLKRRKAKHVSLRVLIPNAITITAMCCALIGVRFALNGQFSFAVISVIIATFLDAMDGRVARLLKGTSTFGANLDSLADVINFGVVPAIILYIWSSPVLGATAWVVLMAYTVCIAIRLARFNTSIDEDQPQWQKGYFTGVPAPMGALLVMIPIYLSELSLPFNALLVLFVAPLVAYCSVSTMPTYSGKQLSTRIGVEYSSIALLGFAVIVGALLNYPWVTLLVLCFSYCISIPFSIRSYNKRLQLSNLSARISKDPDAASQKLNDELSSSETQLEDINSAELISINNNKDLREKTK